MTNAEMALSHLRQAGRILVEAEHHHQDGAWNLVVRRCQESVELALKAVLRSSISRRLRQECEISFYGNEEIGAPPERLYSADDAAQALGDARFVLDLAGAHVR